MKTESLDKQAERILKRLGNYQCENQLSIFDLPDLEQTKEPLEDEYIMEIGR